MTQTQQRPGRSSVLVRAPRRTEEQAAAYARRRRWLELGLATAVPVALLVLWQLAASAGWIDDRLYPPPSKIIATGRDEFRDGGLASEVWITTKRILEGLAFGAVTGLIVGAAMGLVRIVRVALEPLLNAFYVVPKLALLPVFIAIFGFGEAPKIVLVSVTVFFFVWIYTMEAFATIPDGYREAARSLNVSRWRMFTDVLLPAALPQIFVALRIGMGVAVLVIVAAEFLVGDTGLGYVIFNAQRLFINDVMYVGIVCVAVLGVVLSAIVTFVGRVLTPWAAPSKTRQIR
ncbi:MAG: putative taurine transport system permease protein [Frankiales bacterium]|nr:putative taurine transport system permease protein [Frankiales bacterium]